MSERIKVFALPDLGEGLTEGEILRWLVAEGDTITLNQPIVEVETAKAAVEIPAKWAGQVQRIFHAEGETLEVGTPIVAIDTDPTAGPLESPDTPAPGSPAPEGEPPPPEAGTPGGDKAPAAGTRTPVLVGYGPKAANVKRRQRITAPSPGAGAQPPPAPATTAAPRPAASAPPAPAATTNGGGPALAKPPVRKLARDLGVDLRTLTGTGPLGVITRDDVHAAIRPPAPTGADPSRERRIPVKGVRKLTAENMVASAFTAPHVSEFLTVDVTRSMRALDRLREMPQWRDVRISPLLMVAKAVLLAIARNPVVNSTWVAGDGPDGGAEIVTKEYVNLGIAAATERGLIVPNIKDAGRLSLRELADALTALVHSAKAGRTAPSDMAGGTFTITNVGVFGVDTGTPILPPGEAAILALGAIRPTPWVHRGEIAIRDVTTLCVSFDHRVIDGESGSKFLRDVGDFLTDPEATLLAWT